MSKHVAGLRLKRWTAGAALGLSLITTGFAQTVNPSPGVAPSENLSTPAPKPNEAAIPSVEHLFGDWGGLRTELERRGVNILLDNTNEFASNVSGGTQHATTNAGQTALQVDIDWEKLAGLRGFSTHSVIVGRYGANLSDTFGDRLSPTQEIFGAGGNVVAHFVYTYAELSLMEGRLNFAAGRMPVGNDFAASPLVLQFHEQHCLRQSQGAVGASGRVQCLA